MPELPEVETVVSELKQLITGKTIETVNVYWAKSFVNKTEVNPSNKAVHKVQRHGKYLIINLDGFDLVVHLRMTGQLLFSEQRTEAAKHDRVHFIFEDDSELKFKDVRKFGRIYFVKQYEEVIAHVGRDALSEYWNPSRFFNMLQRHTMSIKALLLSQKHISGLGNIYVDESLFAAGIHPASCANSIPEEKTVALFNAVQDILNFAIKNMGSTISDYRDVNGKVGKAQNFFKVYQQQGLPCRQCTTKVIKKKMAGRGTHFCPECQVKWPVSSQQ